MLIKLGETTVIQPENIQDTSIILADADLEIAERMKKFAQNLKTIAPQAQDFLYFTAVMMHAAEAAILDDDGKIKKDAKGNDLTAKWEKVGEDSIRWVCSDPNIRPLKNANGDIFPEEELKKAYKKWIGRPLCLDHKSSSVDMVRGVIVDTYWDADRKRIISLCALDKKNYPDLARKVESGYATNVSMGTAVARAVCTEDGCHRVARIESDFCDHMRRKSGYGEINLDLNPIELSLVVTGADPRAKVKHIIAKDLSEARTAVAALQDYLDGKIALASVETMETDYIKEELAKLNERVHKLAAALEANGGDIAEAQGMTESLKEPKEVEVEKPAYVLPEAIPSYANDIGIAREKLAEISEVLNKLELHNSKDKTMTEKKAYYQGTEEPTPGKPRYPVDPGNAARLQDKHMVGQKPFPDVGPVDGMHPGVESQPESSEAERKKRLHRLADAERREKLRKAALEKAKETVALESKGYYQGTEEPTPGKAKYTADPLQEQAKMQDKHMVGKKPFPEVGKVDGLYGDDLATKEKLSRAAPLKATFKKEADENGVLVKGASTWTVYAGDVKILTASVDEITRGNSETVYDAVATKEFGKSMIKKILTDGFESARSHFKGAQLAPEVQTEGAPDLGMPEAPEMEKSEGFDIKDSIMKAKDALDEVLDHLEKGADVISDDASDLGAVQAAPEDEAGFAKSSLASMRRTLSGLLDEGFKEAIAGIKSHKEELEAAEQVWNTKYASMPAQQKAYYLSLVGDCVNSAKQVTAEAKELMTVFVRYAQGTEEALRKNAQVFDDGFGRTIPEESDIVMPTDEIKALPPTNTFPVPSTQDVKVNEFNPDVAMADDKKKKDDKKDDDKDSDKKDKDKKEEDKNDASVSIKPEDLDKLKPETKVHVEASAEYDINTNEGRAMYRAKLAQKGVTFSDMLNKAHPSGAGVVKDIATGKDNLKVERIDEISKAMNQLALAPVKVRKQAEEIHRLVSEGKLEAAEVDGLAAFSVDKDAIAYYKKYWAEAKDPEASQFATLLTQEKTKATKEAELEVATVKIKRAHELAYEMRDRGIIDTAQISQQIDEIMSWNDEGFNSVKRMVAKQEPVVKTAMPQVGFLHSEEIYLPGGPQYVSSGTAELSAALDAHFSSKRPKLSW